MVTAVRAAAARLAWRPAAAVGLLATILVVGPQALWADQLQTVGSVTVTGVATNNSSAKVYYQPVPGAKDYRVYDIAAPNNVKYAGLAHLIASSACPGDFCQNHFVAQADGVTPVFPYQVASGGNGGPQALDVPATDIEWNSLGDGQPHTLVVEAVDQLGPVSRVNLYTGEPTTPLVNPLPSDAMLGGNKGPTDDGNVSTNGQGPYTNKPQVIARSQPFVVRALPGFKAIPSRDSASQAFFDTFDNAEGATIQEVARSDGDRDAGGNLGSMTFTMNGGTPREWTIEYRQADNINSMPFIASDHFMDVLFDGATPGVSAPGHTIYGSMAMTPKPTVDISNGKLLHLTMEVDGHQSFRRWLAINLAPASDPLQAWNPFGQALNKSNRALFLDFRDRSCSLTAFAGPAGGTTPEAKQVLGCSWEQMFNANVFSQNGFGLDDRSRYDLFLTQKHAAVFQDGRLLSQADIPAGVFDWAQSEPLRVYYAHYLYHSSTDQEELKSFEINGAGICYPLNSFWFNDPLKGTAAAESACKTSYPAGYGFPYSDERHWDNMGFEVLPAAEVPANGDYASLGSAAALPTSEPPAFGAPAAAAASPSPPVALQAAAAPIARQAMQPMHEHQAMEPTDEHQALPATDALVPPADESVAPAEAAPAPAEAAPPPAEEAPAPAEEAPAPPAPSAAPAPTAPPAAVPVPAGPALQRLSGPPGQWVSVNPAGVSLDFNSPPTNFGFNSVVVDPSTSGTVYVGTNYQGLYRSTDYGATWTKVNSGPGGTLLDEGRIWSLAIDPFDSHTLYAASGYGAGGPLKSTDGGVSWTNLLAPGSPIEQQIGTNDIYAVAADPDTPGHLLLSFHNYWHGDQESGILESVDGGATWSLHNAPAGSGWGAGDSVWFLDNRQTWLLGSQSAGYWRTADGGQTWQQVSTNNMAHGGIYSLYRNPVTGVLVTAVWNGIMKSTDDGVTWRDFTTGLPYAAYTSVIGDGVNVYTAPGFPTGGDNGQAHGPWYAAPEVGMAWAPLPNQQPCFNGQCSGPVQGAFDAAAGVLYSANWNAGLFRIQSPAARN